MRFVFVEGVENESEINFTNLLVLLLLQVRQGHIESLYYWVKRKSHSYLYSVPSSAFVLPLGLSAALFWVEETENQSL